MPTPKKGQAPRDRGALASGIPVVRELSKEDRLHAAAVVAEFVLGLRGAPVSVTPAHDAQEILGALGLLPDQPKPQSSEQFRRSREKEAERSRTAAKTGRPKTDTRARSRVEELSAVRLDGEHTHEVDPV